MMGAAAAPQAFAGSPTTMRRDDPSTSGTERSAPRERIGARRHSKPRTCAGAADDEGSTLVEVMVAGTVLSVVAVGLVNAWTVMDRMSFDTLLRQKAVFVLNAEMERLAALFAYTRFGELNASRPETTDYPAVANLSGGSTRRVYATASVDVDFEVTTAAAFAASDDPVWVVGTGAAARNYVWLDRGRNLAARISWTECGVSDTVVATCWDGKPAGKTSSPVSGSMSQYSCFNFGGSIDGDRCRLIQLVLEYSFRVEGTTVTPVAAGGGRRLTLSTVVGRRYAIKE